MTPKRARNGQSEDFGCFCGSIALKLHQSIGIKPNPELVGQLPAANWRH
jgi:hypothetical protein